MAPFNDYLTITQAKTSQSNINDVLQVKSSTQLAEPIGTDKKLLIGVKEIYISNTFKNVPSSYFYVYYIFKTQKSHKTGSQFNMIKERFLADVSNAEKIGDKRGWIRDDEAFSIAIIRANSDTDRLHMLKAQTYDAEALIKVINDELKRLKNVKRKGDGSYAYPHLSYDKVTKLVTVHAGVSNGGSHIVPGLGRQVMKMLGLLHLSENEAQYIRSHTPRDNHPYELVGDHVVDLHENRFIFLRTDLIRDSYIGSGNLPSLLTLEASPSIPYGAMTHHHFNNPTYHVVKPREFDTINLYLQSSNGEFLDMHDFDFSIVLSIKEA